jgi:energy-coupling factor transporter ATP-binding protein EcfA2
VQHQLDLLDRVTGLPMTTVVTLHDLNLAATFCDRLVVLSRGAAGAAGRGAHPGPVVDRVASICFLRRSRAEGPGCHRNSLWHLLTFRLCLSFFSGRTVKQLDEVLAAISPKIRALRTSILLPVERTNTQSRGPVA